jgi:hypothetical protein
VWEGLQDSMKASRDARKKIEETFASDMKLILTPEQVERWPAVERAQRRDQTLRRGFLSGERVDLFVLVEEAKLPEEAAAAVKPVLDQYDVDMDRELAKRNDTYENSFEKMGELRREGDMEGLQELIKEGREAGARVRDLNRRFARQLTDLLPEDQKPVFEMAFKRASFPEVYRPTQASRAITAAIGFDDITDAQKEQLNALNARYSRDLEGVNEKLAKGIEEGEMNFDMGNFMNRDREEGPLADLRRERRDVDRTAMDEVRKILTAEQQERLPKPDNDGQRRERNRGDRREPGEDQT